MLAVGYRDVRMLAIVSGVCISYQNVGLGLIATW